MGEDPSYQALGYSLSRPTEVSVHYKATLELGRKLINELNLEQSVDTLGRWMAHYIAELIQNAEQSNDEERPAKMRACSEAILNLWKHRHTILNGKGPFYELEPILRALASLDPDDETPRYFRSVRAVVNVEEEKNETMDLLELIDELDFSARKLISYYLNQAASNALNKSKEWVKLAEAAGVDEGIEFSIIPALAKEANSWVTSDPDEITGKRLESHIDRLESFVSKATELISILKQRSEMDYRDKENL